MREMLTCLPAYADPKPPWPGAAQPLPTVIGFTDGSSATQEPCYYLIALPVNIGAHAFIPSI